MKKKLWFLWSVALWMLAVASIAFGQQRLNPETQIQVNVPVTGPWLVANQNNRFYVDGFPSSGCSVGGTAYTTQLDCAVATANAAVAANGNIGETLVLGAGTYNTCVGIALPAISTQWGTLSIVGAGQEQTVINLTCALANGSAVISHADNAQLGRTRLANFRINANGNASQCMSLFGINLSTIENINCSQPAGNTGGFSNEGTTAFYTFGDSFANGGAGSFYQNVVKNLTATGPSLPSAVATGTATVSGGNVTSIAITAGGAGYQSAYAYAFIGGYGNLDATHSWFPQPCYFMPAVAVTVTSGAVTGAVPSGSSENCSGTITNVTFWNLSPINYPFYINNGTDNTFIDLNCGSAARNACVFNGAANNKFYHIHPNGGIYGVMDFGRGDWYGTEFDSIIANSAMIESASHFDGTTFTWNQAASAGYYSYSGGFFFNGSIGATLGAPGNIAGTRIENTGRCNQSFDNVPTGYNDYWDQSGPFGTTVPAGVTIANSNPCSLSTGTQQTVMGEPLNMNATNIWKNNLNQTGYNSNQLLFTNSYYGFHKDNWTLGTASDTTPNALPLYQELDFLTTGAQSPLGSLAGTVPYVWGFGYAGAAGQATAVANADSPWLASKASWWSGAAQYVSCGPHVHPLAGTSQPIQIIYGCSSTGTPGEIQWQFQGGRIQLYNPAVGYTLSLKADNIASSVTLQALLAGTIVTETDSPTSGNIAQSCGLGCVQGSAYTPASTQVLHGTTGSIGGSLLAANACASGTATVTGAATTNPIFDPIAVTSGAPESSWATTKDFTVEARVTASNTVTVKVCALIAGTPVASTYYVRVLPQ